MSRPDYVLGHSADELRRLDLQADMIRPITRRLLVQAGLGPGMRVLDVGCGTGDVTMLAASIVGPSGYVLGVDREAAALEFASSRRDAAPCPVEFRRHDFDADKQLGQFDLSIGRYVLMYQTDPASFIRRLSSHVVDGGIIAFHEICVSDDLCRLNRAPLFRSIIDMTFPALASATAHPEIAGRLGEVFAAAGMPGATLAGEMLIYADAQAPYYEWLSLMTKVLLPQAERIGIASAAGHDVHSLERRLREEALALGSQAIFPAQFTAWARKVGR